MQTAQQFRPDRGEVSAFLSQIKEIRDGLDPEVRAEFDALTGNEGKMDNEAASYKSK
jgi:hypothetical protein